MNKNVSDNRASDSCTTDYLDGLKKSKGSNRDADGLGAMVTGPFIIGSVDAINGDDGKEVPEFAATRHELKQLAEYWAQERVECDFDWFVYQSSGSIEWRWSAYINRRLNRLSKLLGPEAMRKVCSAAIESFRKRSPKITNEDWRVFTEGTQEEQEEWRDRVFGEHEAGDQEMQNDDELRESETTKPENTK